MKFGKGTLKMNNANEKIITTPLKPSDVKRVKSIIRKTRNAKTLQEIEHYNNEIKKIDAKNRRKAITESVVAKYKR